MVIFNLLFLSPNALFAYKILQPHKQLLNTVSSAFKVRIAFTIQFPSIHEWMTPGTENQLGLLVLLQVINLMEKDDEKYNR